MPESNNLTDETLVDAAQLTAADGGAAVDNTLSLAALNQTLGKNFKDVSTALAALKETQSYVGRKIEAANPAPADSSLKDKVQSLEEEVFYANHPEYREQRELIKQFGKAPSEVVELEAFKNVFEKVKVADEVQKTKSVVNSNARIGQAPQVLDEAIQVANSTKSVGRTADVLARGIMEEFGM